MFYLRVKNVGNTFGSVVKALGKALVKALGKALVPKFLIYNQFMRKIVSSCAAGVSWLFDSHLPTRSYKFEGLTHGQRCRHLFSDSEAYHKQMGPIPSSNGSLEMVLSIVHTWSPRRHAFQIVGTELLMFPLNSRLMRCCLNG